MDDGRNLIVKECEEILNDNILSFWMKYSADYKNHTFFGQVDRNGEADKTAEKGGILFSRILWAFSAAYNQIGNDKYLETAEMAYDCLRDTFWDKEHGGIFFSIDYEGNPLDARKMTDCQCYALYGLSELFSATGRNDVYDMACEIVAYLEGGLLDCENSGYYSHLNRDYTKDSNNDYNVKTLNAHVHVLEAYTSFYSVNKSEIMKDSLENIFDLICGFYREGFFSYSANGNFTEFTNYNWYGLNLETAWLLYAAAQVLDDRIKMDKASAILIKSCDWALKYAFDSDGGLYYDGNAGVPEVMNKEGWPQTEAMIAFAYAYKITDNYDYLEVAKRSFDFLKKYIIDFDKGEWINKVDKYLNDTGDPLKISFWKCPYHNTRGMLKMIELLS